MVTRVALLLLIGALATCSRAERVRVEFEASLIEADPNFVDPAQTVRGHYEFNNTITRESTPNGILGQFFYSALREFVITSDRGSYTSFEGQVISWPDGSGVLNAPINGLPSRGWSVRVGPVSNDVPIDSQLGGILNRLLEDFTQVSAGSQLGPLLFVRNLGPTFAFPEGSELNLPQRLPDDLNDNDSNGQILVLADLNGNGIIEAGEVVATATDLGDVNQILVNTPAAWLPEVVIDFTLGESLPAIDPSQLAPASLEALSSATLTLTQRVFDADLSTTDSGDLEAQYEITSLRIVTVPEPQSLLLIAGMLGITNPFRRCRR